MSDIQTKGARNGPPPPGMIVPRHGGGLLRPIRPGETRNPGGKGGLWQETQRFCREKSPEAAKKLYELLGSPDERVALMAADKLMTWGWGKPPDYDPNQDRRPPQFDASKLTLAQQKQMLMLLRLGVGGPREGSAGQPEVEAEVTQTHVVRPKPRGPAAPTSWE